MSIYRPLTIAYVVVVWGLSFILSVYLLIDYLRHGKGYDKGRT